MERCAPRPIHIAAKGGHSGIVGALIECRSTLNSTAKAKKMLRMVNEAGDTALHEATRNGSLEIVKMLIEKIQSFLTYPINLRIVHFT